ncbi:MAG: DUF1848 domain-containing protein [Erysipelotrichaceae bacterium]|nr:DUF1848 domain-containing protein [Erysipelotrichaceae bacterium]
MILNTGSRTDIPAFYSEWFMNRIREGFVMARNPFDPKRVIRYDLDPSLVDAIVFCTKDPSKMLQHIDELKRYHMYWNVTITPYGKEIEENVPHKKDVMDSFIELSKKVGINNIVWRYDPIFLNECYTLDYHLLIFEKMAKYMEGYCNACIISFIDLYEKTKRNFPEVREVSYEDQCTITKEFVKIAKKYGMVIRLCHEDRELEKYGADASGCLSKKVLEKAIGETLNVKRSLETRKGCDCLLGNDIGAYNSCLHFCRYCYANFDKRLVIENRKKHDPKSPLLIGNIEEDDIISVHESRSFIDDQLHLF